MKLKTLCTSAGLAAVLLVCGKSNTVANNAGNMPSYSQGGNGETTSAKEVLQYIYAQNRNFVKELRRLTAEEKAFVSNKLLEDLLLDLKGEKKMSVKQKQGYPGLLKLLEWKINPLALLPILNNEAEDDVVRASILDYIGTSNDARMKPVVREYVKKTKLILAQPAACACWQLSDKDCVSIIRERIKKLNLPKEFLAEKSMNYYIQMLESGKVYTPAPPLDDIY